MEKKKTLLDGFDFGKLPEYEFALTNADLRDIDDYRNTVTEYRSDNGTVTKQKVSEFNVAMFALELGLTSLKGEKVTKDNFNEMLDKHLSYLEIKTIYYDMWFKAVKKK